jgi:hypothetical protein
MKSILNKILKYKWILASLLAIIIFYILQKRINIENFACGSLNREQDCNGNNQCLWQWQKGTRTQRPHWQCVSKP